MNKTNDLFFTSVAGCVLAGGQSRRMGTDKALLKVDGKTLIETALERFSGLPEIFISAASADSYVFTGFRIVPDELPGMGPLGGFIAALKASKSDFVCFRPVDVPLVPAELHLLLAKSCFGKDAAVPIWGGSTEPLLACLSKTALPVLENLLASGKLKVSETFPMLDMIYLDLNSSEIKSKFGEPSRYLVNVNDPKSFSELVK